MILWYQDTRNTGYLRPIKSIHLKDTYRHKGLRKKLVETLRRKGIRDEAVLQAIDNIPRHLFLDKAFEESAYEDRAFPIGEHQTISQPYTVAYQSVLLNVKKRDMVLEIGTGSGYQACVLAELGARVFTVERHQPLHISAKAMFELLGYPRIRAYLRDGYKGLREFAPFDKILVTAAAPYIPDALLEQLKPGGSLVIPVGIERQTMTRVTRDSEKGFVHEQLDAFRFVPFLKGVEKS